MAISSVTSLGCKLHIEAMQSVMPTKPTDPRLSCRIQVPQNLSLNSIFQRRFHIVLCFSKASEDDSGWLAAGWLKESLGRVMEDHPMIAGRLRPSQENGPVFQIVSNDSGVRMVEARVEMKLTDFVELKAKREAEVELVVWEDVVEQNPQFSPLFYVQITNFSCGGYSIGISCSLLLADPFVLTSILKNWTNIHQALVSKPNLPKLPLFYLPKFGKPSPSLLIRSNTGKNVTESVVFTIPTGNSNSDNNIHVNFAATCIDEAEQVIGRKMASKFSLILKVPSEDTKVEICSRQGLLENSSSEINGLTCEKMWPDELGLDNICFNEGNKPAYVSCWINWVVDEGSVMIIPSNDMDSAMKVIVAFT